MNKSYINIASLVHTSKEQKDISWRLPQVDLHDSNEGSIEIISFWFLCIQDFYGECPSRYSKYRCFKEILRELHGI